MENRNKSRNRFILRNGLLVSALTAVLAAGGSIRPTSAHAHHGLTKTAGMPIGRLACVTRCSRQSIKHTPESGNSFQDSGLASVYSGHHTASGEQMDAAAMTAAHRTLPFGTKVTVINHGNGRSAVVRINDRGPFVQGRVIDLSPAAAREIGVNGLTPVLLRMGDGE